MTPRLTSRRELHVCKYIADTVSPNGPVLSITSCAEVYARCDTLFNGSALLPRSTPVPAPLVYEYSKVHDVLDAHENKGITPQTSSFIRSFGSAQRGDVKEVDTTLPSSLNEFRGN
jgi:hypothetical protein